VDTDTNTSEPHVSRPEAQFSVSPPPASTRPAAAPRRTPATNELPEGSHPDFRSPIARVEDAGSPESVLYAPSAEPGGRAAARFPIGIDGRWEICGELLPELRKAYPDPEAFDRLVEAHDIRAAVLARNTSETRQMISWLSRRKDWVLGSRWMQALVFERREARGERRQGVSRLVSMGLRPC
jgi:hypothetical protein